MRVSLLQEQTLRLAMTQELRQAITMLQYSAQELTEFLYEQSLSNPLIELRSFDRTKRKKAHVSTANQMEIYSVPGVTLQQHLLDQFTYLKLDPSYKKTAEFIVYNMDENGYLRESDEEIASLLRVPVQDVKVCVELIQTLEPAGVGARTLQECLTLQLKRLQNRSTIAEMIVDLHFAAFSKKDWRQLAAALKCETEELQAAVDLILTLQPKPGLAFSSERPMYVVPDMIVSKVKDQFIIQMNDGHIPKIEIQPEYKELIGNAEKEVASYVSEKYQHVRWIMKSLEQRQTTLLRVMEVILERQLEFFKNGPLFVKPLSLQEVAGELSLHESTVSRATRNKFVQTPHGLFEMKYFFSNAVSADDEDGVSAKRVKELIKSYVEQEKKQKPLSDQKISDMLQKDHQITISRRTVAKYREQLHIPASSLRKTIG